MDIIKNIFISNVLVIAICGVAYILDFITGITKAIVNKNIQSSKLKKSMNKGIVYFAYIVMGICLQAIFPFVKFDILTLNVDVFVYFACLYIITTEFLSVCENGKEFLKAKGLTKFLKAIQNKLDNTDIDIN